ncbi:MAG: DUF2059 domain-containing protein [Opitutae bacterium]|nr:DUF2059 domain-containing protein [Opitutae bacterium]
MKHLKVLLSSLALSSLALAQSNAPQAAPAAPAPTVAAPAVDAAKLALAREVIAAMQADKMLDRMTAQMKQMAMQMTALPSDTPPAKRAKAEALSNKIMDLSMEAAKGMIAKMDALYAEVYSEAELKAMKAFFASPEGQSMLAKQPQVMQRVMPLAQAMQTELMPKIQQLVQQAQAEEAAEAAAATETPAAKATEPAK